MNAVTTENALVAKLDCFDEAWAKKGCKRTWGQVRLNAVTKTRELLLKMDADDVHVLVDELHKRASVARSYRQGLCKGRIMLRFELEFYALVHRCLELDPWARIDMLQIAREQEAPEIADFIKGGIIP